MGVLILNHQSFTPVPGIGGQKFFAWNLAEMLSNSCTWCHKALFQVCVLPPKTCQKHKGYLALLFWKKVKPQNFFNCHLEMNLPVQWNTKLWFILEFSSSWWFQRGSKVPILVGVLILNHQSFTPVPYIRGQKFFYMQTCPEVLYKLHMVSYGSVLTLCFAPKNLPKTQML